MNKNEAIKAGFRVMVVDDESSIRDCLSWLISDMGFDVSVAGDGREALGLLNLGSFGIVITDLNMPGMDGFMLSCKIKEKSPATKIVLLTGATPAFLNEKSRRSCVDLVLSKPFKFEGIENTILQIQDKVRDRSPIAASH